MSTRHHADAVGTERLAKRKAVSVLISSTRPSLQSIAKLLSDSTGKAKTFVRGTDSQKSFNAQFHDFCRFAQTMGLAELEEELQEKITLVGFLSEVGSYIAHQSGGKVTQAYTDQLAKSLLAQSDASSRIAQDKRDQEAAALQKRKRSRQEPLPALEKPPTRAGGGAPPPPQNSVVVSHPAVTAPVPTSASTTTGVAAAASPAILATPHLESPMEDDRALSPLNLADGSVDESSGATLKLTAHPQYQPLLMPWTIAPTYPHGFSVDRVAVERAPQPPPPPPPPAGNSAGVGTGGPSRADAPRIFDICSAPNAVDMMAAWERRETVIANEAAMQRASPGGAAGPGSTLAVDRISSAVGSCETPLVRPMAAPSQSPLALNLFPSATHMQDVVDALPYASLVQLVHAGVCAVDLGPKSL